MTATSDRRPGMRRTRRTVQTEANIEVAGRALACQLLDLSISGARIARPNEVDLVLGQLIALLLPLDKDRVVRIDGRIARAAETEFGIAFQHLSSETHASLERFIEREGRILDALEH